VSAALTADVLAHLAAQVDSAGRLLDVLLQQAVTIRDRDVEGTLAQVAGIQTEMHRRSALEQQRATLLARAGAALGVPANEVTIERLAPLMGPQAAHARARSAELRGLLEEVRRRNELNRALMRQELAFLDHLTRLIGREPDAGYGPRRETAALAAPPRAAHHLLDMRA
jgi:flagellar biosynthesis/type III secretory pathway chaperone